MDQAAAEARIAELEAEVASLREETASLHAAIWEKLASARPNVFATGTPADAKTTDRLMDAFCTYLDQMEEIEAKVFDRLAKLRNQKDPDDPLNAALETLHGTPKFLNATRDYISKGIRRTQFAQSVRMRVAWLMAMAEGAYQAIVEADAKLRDEFNLVKWPIPAGRGGQPDDAAVGKHFKESIRQQLPDRFGTELRKRAGKLTDENYNSLM